MFLPLENKVAAPPDFTSDALTVINRKAARDGDLTGLRPALLLSAAFILA